MKKIIGLIGMVILLTSAMTPTTDVLPSGLINYSEVVIGNRDTSVLYFDGDFMLSDELAKMWESGRFSNKPVRTYVIEHDSFKRLSWRSATIHVTK